MRYLDKKTILCSFLLGSSVAMAGTSNGLDVNNVVNKVFGLLDDNERKASGSSNTSMGGLLNLGSSEGQSEEQSVPNLPQGISGLTADAKTNPNGGSVVNHITYNINNSRNVSLPEGYQQQTGADGKPLPAETKVGADGKPVKIIKAINAAGKPVEIEEKTDAKGKPVLVEKKKNPQTGQVETKTLPTTPQAPAAAESLGQVGTAGTPQLPQLSGKSGATATFTGQAGAAARTSQLPQLPKKSDATTSLTGQAGAVAGLPGEHPDVSALSGLTRERLLEVITNPYNSQNIAAYEQIKALAMQDPEDKSALETLNDHVPLAKAKTIRLAVLEKYIDQILNNQQVAAQNAQQQQLAAQQALLAQQEAERKRQESIRQESDRLMIENKQLVAELEAAGTPKRVIADAFEDARREVTGADVTSVQQQNIAAQTRAQQGVVQQAASGIPQNPQLPRISAAQVTIQPQGALQQKTATAGIPQIPQIPGTEGSKTQQQAVGNKAAPAGQLALQQQTAAVGRKPAASVPQIPQIPQMPGTPGSKTQQQAAGSKAAPAGQLALQQQTVAVGRKPTASVPQIPQLPGAPGAGTKKTATGIPQIPEIPKFGG